MSVKDLYDDCIGGYYDKYNIKLKDNKYISEIDSVEEVLRVEEKIESVT